MGFPRSWRHSGGSTALGSTKILIRKGNDDNERTCGRLVGFEAGKENPWARPLFLGVGEAPPAVPYPWQVLQAGPRPPVLFGPWQRVQSTPAAWLTPPSETVCPAPVWQE